MKDGVTMNKLSRQILAAGFGLALLLQVGPGLAQDSSDPLDEPVTTRGIINQLQFKDDAPDDSVTTRSIGGTTRGAKVVLPQPEVSQESGATAVSNTETTTDTIAEVASIMPSINMRIQFELNSFDLTGEARQKLEVLGEALSSEELSSFRFLIAGHTDATGSASYNQSLSERRADAVKFFLAARFPTAGQRLVSQGYGEEALFDSNDPNSAINRRVQIINLGTNN